MWKKSCITWHSLMQLINNFEKILVKSPGGELSSAFGTSKDNLRLLKYPNIICLDAWGGGGGRKEAVVVFLPVLYESLYIYIAVHHQAAAIYTYMAIFKRLASMVSYTICVMTSEFYPDT